MNFLYSAEQDLWKCSRRLHDALLPSSARNCSRHNRVLQIRHRRRTQQRHWQPCQFINFVFLCFNVFRKKIVQLWIYAFRVSKLEFFFASNICIDKKLNDIFCLLNYVAVTIYVYKKLLTYSLKKKSNNVRLTIK